MRAEVECQVEYRLAGNQKEQEDQGLTEELRGESPEKNRQVEHHDAAVGGDHELSDVGSAVLPLKEKVIEVREEMACRQGDCRWPRPSLQQVDGGRLQSVEGAIGDSQGRSIAEQGEDEDAMHEAEKTVVDAEKRDEKQLGKVV